MRLPIGYPTAEDEKIILNHLRREHPINHLKAVVTEDSLLEFQRAVWEVNVDNSILDYVVRLVTATRTHPDLVLGGSPRASLALYKTSQALAALRGRDYVIPDDIKYLAPVTLSHRIIIKPEAELRGRSTLQVLAELLNSVPLELGLPG
jgi:MoxR-like ATPase